MNNNSSSRLSPEKRYQEIKRVTLISIVTNSLLSVSKMLGGWLGYSQALLADGVHSLSDLLTDILVWIAAKYGGQAADDNHPYGHARIETVATLALALLLILVGFGIAWDVLSDVLAGHNVIPDKFVLWFAAFSIIANEGLYRYTLFIGKKIKSDLLIANALHSRSDAASSVVVLIGVGGSLLGIPYMDAVAAIIVAIFIGKMGWSIAWSNLRELVDTGLSKKELQHIKRVIHNVPGVNAIHELRSRRMAGRALLDVHIIVTPYLSVSEGHHIGERVMYDLLQQVEEVDDVIVHVDHENDEPHSENLHLPLRQELLPQLKLFWQGLPGYDYIDGMNLHYLTGNLSIEVLLPHTLLQQYHDIGSLQQDYLQAAQQVNDAIIEVKLLFHQSRQELDHEK